MVSNQTAFPSTVHKPERKEREKERERKIKERLLHFDLAMHCVFMGPYIREDEKE